MLIQKPIPEALNGRPPIPKKKSRVHSGISHSAREALFMGRGIIRLSR